MEKIYHRTEGKPEKGHVVILHGLGSHSGMYDHVIRAFVEDGYQVHAFDYPGHGRSAGKRGHTTVEDIMEILHSIVSTVGEPVVLYGKSLGGLVAVRYAQEHPDAVRAIVLESPSLGLARRSPFKMLIGKVGVRLLPNMTVDTGIRPEDLTRNPEYKKRHESDPFYHSKISFALFDSMLRNIAKAHCMADRIYVPTLILLGACDHLVNRARIVEFYRKIPAAVKKLTVFSNARHDVTNDPDHGVPARQIMLEWLEGIRPSEAPREGSE